MDGLARRPALSVAWRYSVAFFQLPLDEGHIVQLAERRKGGMRTFVERLAELHALQTGLTVQRATDVMFVVNSHEVFLGLTRDSGWWVTDF